MSDAFSTPASHAFDHPELDVAVQKADAGPSSMGDAASSLTLEQAFDIEHTSQLILGNGYKIIGLQFPDELLPSSIGVYRALMRRIKSSGAQAYVLADSTYGSCCPDVLSCLHLPADFLVHYGHACLTPTNALYVHYVFPQKHLDIEDAVKKLLAEGEEEEKEKGIIVIWDVAYDWLAETIVSEISSKVGQRPVSFSRILRPRTGPMAKKVAEASDEGKGKAPTLRNIEPPQGLQIGDCVIWYLGEEGRGLLNLQMTHAGNALYAYSPTSRTVTLTHKSTSRLLSRRLFALHQAMSADVFGLVVGNIGLASSRPLLEQMRNDLKRAKKKSYTLTVGRLNPAKLANFAEVECFVLVGCAEGGVVDSKDFLRPIITPWELTLALQGSEHEWDPSKWTLDLAKVLQTARQTAPVEIDEEPQFSLVSGTYRTRKIFGSSDTEKDNVRGEGVEGNLVKGLTDLTVRNQEFSLAKLESAGSMFLSTRHFQGLDPRYGMDEPSQLEEGRTGIARGYTEEKEGGK